MWSSMLVWHGGAPSAKWTCTTHQAKVSLTEPNNDLVAGPRISRLSIPWREGVERPFVRVALSLPG